MSAADKWYQYNRFDPIEVRIYKALFWIGVLVLVLWVEVVIGLAVWNLFKS